MKQIQIPNQIRFLLTIGFIIVVTNSHSQALALTWQKVLGGSENEFSKCIAATNDGGYILGGVTLSSASGNVTQTNQGNGDIWIIKTDVNGIILWQKLIGDDS
jgi:hypothetical protein